MIRLRRTSRSRASFIGAVALTIALLLALARLLAPGLLLSVFSPVFAVGDALSARVAPLFGGLRGAHALAAANERLSEENAALLLENQTLAGRLVDLSPLLATTTLAHDGVLAGVLARPPASPYDTLIVSAGRAQGVVAGMEAFGASSGPLGVVTAVEGSFARVRLFSSPGVETNAWVGNARVPVTLAGEGAGAFSASVPQGAGIEVGDEVAISGPGALPIGWVAHISGAPSDPIETLAIAPLINEFSATWVRLVDTGGSLASTTMRLP